MACDCIRYATYDDAMRARWAMAQQGRDIPTEKLRPKKCEECGGWHLRRVGIEPIAQRANHYWECRDCGFEWTAPAANGCPKCHSETIQDMGPSPYRYAKA